MSNEQNFINHLQAELRYARERGDRYKALAARLQAEVLEQKRFRESAEGGRHEANRVVAMQREQMDAQESELTKARLKLDATTHRYGPPGRCRVLGCDDPTVTPDGLCKWHADDTE